jgi:hypothetical protein
MTKVQTLKTATSASPKPKADDVLIAITESVLAYRGEARPNLATIARLINRSSALLRISDLDERMSVENLATVSLAKKLGLMA